MLQQGFLYKPGNATEVHCVDDSTKVYRVEGHFLDVLFGYEPQLCGKFYHSLANDIAQRLQASMRNKRGHERVKNTSLTQL